MSSPGTSKTITSLTGALNLSDPTAPQCQTPVVKSTVSASVVLCDRRCDVIIPKSAGCREFVGNGCWQINSGGEKAQTIDGLHPEILRAVFDFATASSNPTKDNFSQVVSLTHVSQLWRVILLNDGRIWSNIHIRGQPPDVVVTQIARCQQASLFVFVEVPPRRTLRANIQEVAGFIRKRRDQVKRLEAHVDCRAFSQQFGCEWPSLTELVWIDTCPVGSCLHGLIRVDPANGGLPRLRGLSVKRGLEWPMNIAAQLTGFKLEGPVDLELSALADFFRKNASLVSVELKHLNTSASSRNGREEPIELPHLTTLWIHRMEWRRILRLPNLPSPKRLWVSSSEGRNPWSDCDWSEPCTRLMITTLRARYDTFPHKKITIVGHSGLDTQSLRFVELSPVT